MSDTRFHVKATVYHRQQDGGTYIARYTVAGRVIEGYGSTIGEALEELGKTVQQDPTADGDRYE